MLLATKHQTAVLYILVKTASAKEPALSEAERAESTPLCLDAFVPVCLIPYAFFISCNPVKKNL